MGRVYPPPSSHRQGPRSSCQEVALRCSLAHMAAKLSKTASGARHARWGREILATAKAHLKHNDRLMAPQKAALEAEVTTLSTRVEGLVAAVGPYRDFLDHAVVADEEDDEDDTTAAPDESPASP